MAAKSNKKAKEKVVKIEETVNIEPESILTETEVKNIEEDEIVEVIAENVEVEEPKHKSVEKTLCRVVVATPTYFVINKNGVSMTINKKNNYKRGDDILY